jgi:hypothetical protein
VTERPGYRTMVFSMALFYFLGVARGVAVFPCSRGSRCGGKCMIEGRTHARVFLLLGNARYTAVTAVTAGVR